jgi:chemotaxis family two-component system sensor kinase Cph1
MSLKRGDHVCSVYSTTAELAEAVARFLAEGLRSHERCWYIGASSEVDSIGLALQELGIDVDAQMRRGALALVSGHGAYVVRGNFDPEATLRIFNDAIEQACKDGFAGFRAAAEMSWALDCEDGPHQVIVYEALLKTLFASCRATGLCLYDRSRMPLPVLDGALRTHPVAGSQGHYTANPFYDPAVTRLTAVADDDVLGRLKWLAGSQDRPQNPS